MKAFNASADGFDYARRFVSHNDGRNTASGASVEAVHVTATNAAGMHANQQLIGSGFGLGHIGDFEMVIG